MSNELLILGAGPAGLSLAAAAAHEGLDVAVLGSDLSWRPSYGLWADQVPEGLDSAVHARWDDLQVHTDGATIAVGRPYVRFDTPRLQQTLENHLWDLDVSRLAGQAITVRHHDRGSTVTDARGREHHATVVVDATGAGTFLERDGEPSLFQTALGWDAEVVGFDGPGRWMDLDSGPDEGPPSFLCALPDPSGRVFVEETVLARVGRPSWGQLAGRLRARLSGLGVRVRNVQGHEQRVIALDRPIPRLDQRTLEFGAAASRVHPSTGDQLAASLADAPRLARVLRDTLIDGPEAAARAAWQTLWTPERRRTHRIHRLGSLAVSRLDTPSARNVFAAFFSLDPHVRHRWLDDDLSEWELLTSMLGVFRRLSMTTRWGLLADPWPTVPHAEALVEAR